ncbi:MAG: hypothetical protein PHV30_01960, partial [Candidatus Margulisbacteria bacterium]|nr:hypothetical protein [Candidatus Margulisiibacteriota bacterium]
MIENMKKISLFLSDKTRKDFVQKLKESGVLHLAYQQTPDSEEISDVREVISKIDEAVTILGAFAKNTQKSSSHPMEELINIADKIIKQKKLQDDLLGEKNRLEKEASFYADWGMLEPGDITFLRSNKIHA